MLEAVAAYIEHYQLFPPGGQIIVAVSGGADSLCLLHLLRQLCGPGKRYPAIRLHVAHLNHRLRGEVGDQEARAVAQLAASWDLPVTVGEIDVPTLARRERRSLEDAARTARYRFLHQVAQGQPIAVAHHADDQLETLLLHLLRGGGLASMVGMLPRQGDIIRPLLGITHAETVAYCRYHQLVPVEDVSNTDPRFLRNRIRHELLPLLETLNPGIRSTLLRNAEVIRVDLAWIEAQVDTAWEGCVESAEETIIQLRRIPLLALPHSIQRHLLRRVTARLCAGQSPLELRHYLLIEPLLSRLDKEAAIALDLPGQLRLTGDKEQIVFARRKAPREPAPFSVASAAVVLPVPGRVEIPGTPWTATAELIPDALARQVSQAIAHEDWARVWRLLPTTRYASYADYDLIGPDIRVRTRQPGDRVRPLGMQQEKKVQDVLVDRHIPHDERALLPLFFSAHHCIWIAGVSIDDRVRLSSKTRRIVYLSLVPTTMR